MVLVTDMLFPNATQAESSLSLLSREESLSTSANNLRKRKPCTRQNDDESVENNSKRGRMARSTGDELGIVGTNGAPRQGSTVKKANQSAVKELFERFIMHEAKLKEYSTHPPVTETLINTMDV